MDETMYRKTIVDILIIAFLIIFPHFAGLPFYSYAVVCFAIIIFYLKRQNKTLADLGFKSKGLSIHAIFAGIISALLWMAFIKFLYFPFINYFFKNYITSYTEYDFIKSNMLNLIMVLIAGWIVGGFYEEIVFRGFIQRVIHKWFAKHKSPFWFAGILTSILFGLYHWQQGIFGVVPAALGGLYWTYMLKRYNGNLWYPIVSHAFYDTVALTMIYLGILN